MPEIKSEEAQHIYWGGVDGREGKWSLDFYALSGESAKAGMKEQATTPEEQAENVTKLAKVVRSVIKTPDGWDPLTDQEAFSIGMQVLMHASEQGNVLGRLQQLGQLTAGAPPQPPHSQGT